MAVLALGLGVGSNPAIFRVVHPASFQPVPFGETARHALVCEGSRDAALQSLTATRAVERTLRLREAEFRNLELRARRQAFREGARKMRLAERRAREAFAQAVRDGAIEERLARNLWR